MKNINKLAAAVAAATVKEVLKFAQAEKYTGQSTMPAWVRFQEKGCKELSNAWAEIERTGTLSKVPTKQELLTLIEQWVMCRPLLSVEQANECYEGLNNVLLPIAKQYGIKTHTKSL